MFSRRQERTDYKTNTGSKMRFFELIVVILLLATLCRYLVPRSKRPKALLYLPIATAFVAIAQIAIEQYRWQMVPAYVLAAILLALAIPALLRRSANSQSNDAPSNGGRFRRVAAITGIVCGFLVWIVAAALPYALPVFQFPKPTGPFAVGTHSFEWIDAARGESLTPDPDDRRDLAIQVWYPAEIATNAKPMKYWPEAQRVGSAIAKAGGLPPLIFDHLALVATHSYLDASVSATQTTYPVVIFSHGIWAIANQNTVQMEELASHGYVVFSISHPYESLATQYPDGRIVPWNNAHRKTFGDTGRATFKKAIKPYTETTDPQLREKLLREAFQLQHMAATSIKTWAADTRFVLDQIERLNRGEISGALTGRLDVDRIGVFGHSFGGSAAGQTCLVDKRCKAGVNMDGLQWGDLLDQPMTQPFMVMNSDDPVRARAETSINDLIYGRGNNPHYRVLIKGSKHGDYTDFTLTSPLFAKLGVMGPIDGKRMEVITSRYVLAFFDKYLKGIDEPLLKGRASEYPEVEFQARNL